MLSVLVILSRLATHSTWESKFPIVLLTVYTVALMLICYTLFVYIIKGVVTSGL
jgi:hypothetical protein